jgi:hypothetical protein
MYISYHDINITGTTTENHYYDHKKNKTINYKKPKVTKKVLCDNICVHDLGEFHETMKFYLEKEHYDKIEVKFNLSAEY